MNDELSILCKKYNCDKLMHGYAEIYKSYFDKIKNDKLNILEIGVANGTSIKVWSDYFKNSNIIGVDIKKIDIVEKKLNRKNIKIFQGSQTDKNFLLKIIEEYKSFDIIIDDGSHYPKDVIKSFELLFPILNIKGLYFVEDMQTSYNHYYHGNAFDLKYANTHMNYFKHLTDSLNYKEVANPFYKKNKYDGKIINVSFFRNIVVIKKDLNDKESNLLTNNAFEKNRYNERILKKGQKLRYFLKYLVFGRTYTFILYIFNTIKKIILLRR